MVRALDSRSRGRGFHFHVTTLGTHVPLSSSSIIWYWSKGGDALQLGR